MDSSGEDAVGRIVECAGEGRGLDAATAVKKWVTIMRVFQDWICHCDVEKPGYCSIITVLVVM